MKVTPRTDDEIKLSLVPDGDYEFTVFDAVETISQAGNEMIKVTLKLKHNNKNYFVNDYLMDTEKMAHKLRHFCKSIGILDDYNNQELNTNNIKDKVGHVKIIISHDKNGTYGTQNKVKDYFVGKETKNENFFDDKLPF